jgi:hypothetical protein
LGIEQDLIRCLSSDSVDGKRQSSQGRTRPEELSVLDQCAVGLQEGVEKNGALGESTR